MNNQPSPINLNTPMMTTSLDQYYDFLSNKIDINTNLAGFTVDSSELHPSLYPHARDIVTWGTRLGRGLIAARFGLHKTSIQNELARLVHGRTGGKFLVVCPLSVRHQFMQKDGPRMGIRWQYVRTDEEIEATDTPYLLTNYERVRDGGIDPRKHDIVGYSLDEGAVLRDLGSKTFQTFNEVLANALYRFICTAVPDPNRYLELINYAHILGVMDRGQALTRFFQRDVDQAGNLTLHPQWEEQFWMWVASWAIFIYEPGDLCECDCHKRGNQ